MNEQVAAEVTRLTMRDCWGATTGARTPAARPSAETVRRIAKSGHELYRCGPGRSAVRRWRWYTWTSSRERMTLALSGCAS